MKHLKIYTPKATLLLLCAIAFFIPLQIKAVPLLIGFFALLNIIDGIINKTFDFSKKPIFWVGVLFFAIHIISVLYSQDKTRAWFDIEVKLSLIIFPVLFLFKNDYVLQRKKNILFSFVIGSLVVTFFMLGNAFLKYGEMGSSSFFYTELSFIHPSYVAMYFIFSIGILIKYILSKQLLYKDLMLHFASILLFIIMIFLLQSKAGIISLIIISLYILGFLLFRLKSILVKIALCVFVFSMIFFMVQTSSRVNAMFNSVGEISETGKSGDTTTGIRFSIWEITINQLKKDWILGVGAGDIKPILFEEYKKTNLENALQKNLNVHNQFLETFLGQGIIGILLLCSLFYFGIIEAIKRKDWLLTTFLILVALSFGPESMLNQQVGVIFFSFFYFFLLLYNKQTEEGDFRPTF